MFLRIPVVVPAGTTLPKLQPRQDSNNGGRQGISTQTSVTIAAVVVGVLVIGLFIMFIRTLRARHPELRYIPTPFLKRLWTNWTPGTLRYQQPAGESESRWGDAPRSRPHDVGRDTSYRVDSSEPMRSRIQEPSATVDRNTSVRSVMTLPAYRSKPIDGEEVLGVAGERDGIDVVVEMPTAEQEEAMRDQEMDALFQIRQARRRQMAEREERHYRREVARASNDAAALRSLREEARAARANNTDEIDQLREDHEQVKVTRQRAVSAVSYAGIGEVRHDGSRARASSNDSERMGLLSDAASMAASTRPSTALSGRDCLSSISGRERSSSVLSVDTARSQLVSPGLPTGGSSRAATPTPRRMSRAGSSPELIDPVDADLGAGTLPPGYDEVSLFDEPAAPASVRSISSGRNTPMNEPPPEYPGPLPKRTRSTDYERMSRHVASMLAPGSGSTHSSPDINGNRRLSTSSGNTDPSSAPQLPSLNLQAVPQIVIEPSTARPRDSSDYIRPGAHY